jgi:Ca2+-binding EF-hand superfamily protein
LLTSLGEDLSTFEIEVVLDVIDVNNDGSLSFEEFIKAVFDGTLKKPQKLNDSQANRLKKFFE